MAETWSPFDHPPWAATGYVAAGGKCYPSSSEPKTHMGLRRTGAACSVRGALCEPCDFKTDRIFTEILWDLRYLWNDDDEDDDDEDDDDWWWWLMMMMLMMMLMLIQPMTPDSGSRTGPPQWVAVFPPMAGYCEESQGPAMCLEGNCFCWATQIALHGRCFQRDHTIDDLWR